MTLALKDILGMISPEAWRALTLSLSLILLSVITLIYLRINLHLDVFLSSIRATIQLIILGFALKYIFSLPLTAGTLITWSIMAGFSTQIVISRGISSFADKSLRYPRSDILLVTFTLIAGAFSVLMGLLIFTRAVTLKPSTLIPLGGMLLGNSVSALSLTYERLAHELKTRESLIEGLIGVGVSPRTIMRYVIPWVLRSVLVPRVDNLKATGLVWIPGLMTGLMFAGMSPIEASIYQLTILVMIFVNTLILSWWTTSFIGEKILILNFPKRN